MSDDELAHRIAKANVFARMIPEQKLRLVRALQANGEIVAILVNRSWRVSAWQSLRQRRNRTVKWIVAFGGTLLVALLTVPWLREAFDFGPLRARDWLVAALAGTMSVAWFEASKIRSRR